MTPRRRKTDKHLPQCVYLRHGAYYYVRNGKWTRLGADLADALAHYARIVNAPAYSVSTLISKAVDQADVKDSTRRQYAVAARHLAEILREFAPEDVKPKHVAQIMDAYADRPAMANRMLSVLRIALDLGVRAGRIDANPARQIRRHKQSQRTRYITDAEYSAILRSASPALRVIMDLCYYTAQRIGDVLSLRLSDMTPEGVVFRQQKTGKALCVAWSPGLRETVDRAKALIPPRKVVRIGEPDYLLPGRAGRKREYSGVRDAWRRACVRAKVADANLHDIRAKSLTDADRQGLDATVLAGHTTREMTLRYLRDRTPQVVTGPSKK